jgi:Ca-activated chloride channel family protein
MNSLKRLTPLLTLALLLPACAESDSAGSDSGADGFGETGWGGDDDGSSGESGGDSTSGTDSGGSDSTGTSGGSDGGDGDEPYDPTGENEEGDTTGDGDGDGDACNLDEPVRLYISPDDSNSMANPAQIKQIVAGTGIPSLNGIGIRPWEFMNYYNFDYAPAAAGELGVSAEMVLGENDGEYRMQIAVSSESMTQAQRPPMNITLVLDTSGSMGGQPMAHMIETTKAIAASLKEGDIVSLLEWDVDTSYKLAGYSVSGPNDATLLEKIGELQAGGGTDLHGGLTTGYWLAEQSFDLSYINRLVLISDGGANVGVTSADLIAQHAGQNGEDGIYMVGVGVADGSYNDHLMDTVTDLGKGASVFVHDESEAWVMFNQNFVNTMAIAARNVQVAIDMPAGFDIVKFSGEEFSGDPTEIEPQHIAPNDHMVFHQVIANCEPDSVNLDDEITITATYQDAWTFESKEVSRTYTFAELLEQESAQLYKGRAVLAYAEALEDIKEDPINKAEYISAALVQVTYAQSLLDGDTDLAEIAEILDAL